MNDLTLLSKQLHAIREERRALADQERDIERQIAELTAQDVVNRADNSVLERRRGTERTKWHPDVPFNRLRTLSRLSAETGEEVARDAHHEPFSQPLKV